MDTETGHQIQSTLRVRGEAADGVKSWGGVPDSATTTLGLGKGLSAPLPFGQIESSKLTSPSATSTAILPSVVCLRTTFSPDIMIEIWQTIHFRH